MHFVVEWDTGVAGDGGDRAAVYEGHADGLDGTVLVGRATGAVHTDLALYRLAPGGSVERHVHAFESCAYVLGGELAVDLDGRAYLLGAGDYVLFPVGLAHAMANPGAGEARWIELSTPIPSPPEGAEDTFFLGGAAVSGAVRPDFASPATRLVGHYLGTAPQQAALAVDGAPRGRAPAGMDTAILAYSGISVKMLVDAVLGADLCTMFTVDYEPGGAAQVHDHPFEEAYFFLEGEIEGEVEGKVRTYRAGEVLFCGVGVAHAFFNTSGARVRWIETQAPQPPRRHAYRWPSQWAAFKGALEGGGL